VVLDSAPILRAADSVLLAKLCRHILFVVEADRVPGALISEAVRRFPCRDRAKIHGVLTRVRPSRLNKHDYYGGYSPQE
jgi:hypothetical protein